ncbi:MAG TPA: 4Fe-4S dicluster domain-containing protein [Chloroflexi bacterium]|nr:4Fe-4S dicluster domain-containing protein [Chloroflexota bacterium]
MKVLSYDPELCVGCYICEEVCSETWHKVNDATKSNIRIHDDGEGGLSANYCVQCGECIEVCPTGALSRDKRGIIRLKKKLCVGCLSCVGFCPYLAMRYHRDQVEPFKCIACGKCADECPAEALAIVEVETPSAPGLQI